MSEDMNLRPISPYALHKLIGEQYATLFARLFDMSIVSLRYFNVFGPRQVTEGAYSLVIGKFLAQKRIGEPLTVYGDGEQTRAYTFVTDVVRANILSAEADILSGENLIGAFRLVGQRLPSTLPLGVKELPRLRDEFAIFCSVLQVPR